MVRNWTKEERLTIVLEGMQSTNISEVCRKHQVALGQWYRWKDTYIEKGEEGLEDRRRIGGIGRREVKRKKPLEIENQKLMEMVGRQALIIEMQKKLLERFRGKIKK